MFIDALLKISAAQAVAGAGTALATSSIDFGSAIRQIGDGEPMTMVVTVDVAADAADGDETYQFDLIQADNGPMTTNKAVIESRVIPRAQLTAGAKVFIPIPKGRPTQEFLSLQYVLGGTTPSITVSAELMPASMAAADPKAYAKNYVV